MNIRELGIQLGSLLSGIAGCVHRNHKGVSLPSEVVLAEAVEQF
jgi:hypothetical protein